jgi:hypothetical protein
LFTLFAQVIRIAAGSKKQSFAAHLCVALTKKKLTSPLPRPVSDEHVRLRRKFNMPFRIASPSALQNLDETRDCGAAIGLRDCSDPDDPRLNRSRRKVTAAINNASQVEQSLTPQR